MYDNSRDYRDYRKRQLSASDKGRGIKVTATGSPGDLIHQSLNSIAANEWLEDFDSLAVVGQSERGFALPVDLASVLLTRINE